MASLGEIAHLLVRQTPAIDADTGTVPEPIEGTPGHCSGSNEYDGRLGLRVSAIFVILLGSFFGQYICTMSCPQALADQELQAPGFRSLRNDTRVWEYQNGPSSLQSSSGQALSLLLPSSM